MIAIIPARGGSKGIPRKNIKMLCGKPMLAYVIEEGLQSKYLEEIIVST
ncbi:MAG: acylneuraminate cytidylyltransferase family protein, partial [Cytophagales bacterium]|nr:acylneuraminate cytidylyltransferase family protein [Cytophagales bacterium]